MNEETLTVPAILPIPDRTTGRPSEPSRVRAAWDRLLAADGGCGGRGLHE